MGSACQKAPIVWRLKASAPIHRLRPFECIHIDHAPLDIPLASGDSRKVLGRPWLSLAIDAESRAMVGFHLSFDPPSYRSCMMVLQDVVRRHGRFPDTIVVDNGADFRSDAFRRACELHGVNLRSLAPRVQPVSDRAFTRIHELLAERGAGTPVNLMELGKAVGAEMSRG